MPEESIIETRGLVREFPGGLRAVDGLSISVRRGEVFSLLGPNGAGKTTTILMMVGLLRPTSGETLIGGERVKARSRVVKEKVGVCPQDVTLWDNLTVYENLRLMGDLHDVPRGESEPRITELLEGLRLSDRRDALSSALSGGMKRRLNLGMALVHDPEIVVLDEPSPGLDPQSRLLLWEYIQAIPKRGGKTVLLTTHYMTEAERLSDRVAIMDHGKLLVMDTPENLNNSLGEGDMVVMTVVEGEQVGGLMKTLRGLPNVLDINLVDNKLYIRARAAVKGMPILFREADRAGVEVLDVQLRRTTLEDVFISLTGRGLRE